jgi:hypothetical protein
MKNKIEIKYSKKHLNRLLLLALVYFICASILMFTKSMFELKIIDQVMTVFATFAGCFMLTSYFYKKQTPYMLIDDEIISINKFDKFFINTIKRNNIESIKYFHGDFIIKYNLSKEAVIHLVLVDELDREILKNIFKS